MNFPNSLIVYSLTAFSLSAQVAPLRWDVQQDRPVAHDVYVWQGETVDLMPRLVQGTLPVAVTNAPVEFRYREASLLPTNAYRYAAASADTNSGVLAVRWIPDYDAGAAWYDYQFIVGSNAVNPRAFGRITMRPTIGWPASTNAPPRVTLYPTRADLQATSNALAGAMQSESQARASTNDLFAAWFGSLFNSTSRWESAFGWGDWHSAVAGKLDSAATNGWETGSHAAFLTNETDVAALRLYHYGSPDIIESPTNWFVFDGAGTITTFNWAEGRESVVIPWAIGGVPVTAIGTGAFERGGIVSVIAPQTVTAIGDYAFYDCFSLASINLPHVTSIGGYVFSSCFSLTSINLPQVTAIGNSAFFYCFSLAAVHMGQNAPAEATGVFSGITTPPNVYVTDPQATGWGAVWNGVPVVRPGLHTDALVLNGTTYTNIPTTDVSGLATTQSVNSVASDLDAVTIIQNNHTANGTIGSDAHASSVEKANWNGKLDASGGAASNLTVRGWIALPQIMPTNLVIRLVTSNEHILVKEDYP